MSSVPRAPCLRLASLRVLRRRRVVVDVEALSFGVGSHVLAGANGSGKSSLLRAVAGLLPASGDIAVDEGRSENASSRTVAYLPQEARGLEHLSVLDAVRYAQYVTGSSGPAEGWVAAVEMSDRAGRTIGSLSGGERRLAYVAMLLSHDASVLLLDEPTAGLDAVHRVALRRALSDAARERVVITASHLADDLDDLGAHVVVLRGGVVVFDGTGEELRAVAPSGRWDAALTMLEGA